MAVKDYRKLLNLNRARLTGKGEFSKEGLSKSNLASRLLIRKACSNEASSKKHVLCPMTFM